MAFRRNLALVCAAIVLAGAAVDASADSRNRRGGGSDRPARAEEGRGMDRGAYPRQPARGAQERSGLTTEERERLRRDIDEASRELYDRDRRRR